MRTLKITIPLMKGDDVAEMQSILVKNGYDLGDIDGKYGKKTKVAVMLFQGDNDLVRDGVCGTKTWAALQALPEPTEYSLLLKEWGFTHAIKNLGEEYAVRQYQAAMGLTVDGIAGTQTLTALRGEVILPRIAERELICGCVAAGKNYCSGFPMTKGAGAGVLLLSERIFREVDKTYPGTAYYISNAAHPTPNGAVAGGYRCTKWNSERSGAAGSKHKACIAMDLYGKCDGVKDSVIRKAIEVAAQKLNTKGGVGSGARYIVHIDTRSSRSRWRY